MSVEQLAPTSTPFQYFTWRRVGAIICVVFYVSCWIAESELLQYVQSGSDSYSQSYFLCWITVSSYTWFLLVWLLWYCFAKPKDYLPPTDHYKRLITASIYLTPWYVGGGYFWYLSLSRTSVSGNIVIYNSSCVFVYIFSVWLLHEAIVLPKVLATLVSLGGVILVAVPQASSSDSDSVSQTPAGYVFVVLSTIMNASYQVLYQRIMVGTSRVTHESLMAKPPAAASLIDSELDIDLGSSDETSHLSAHTTDNALLISPAHSTTRPAENGPKPHFIVMMDTFLFMGSMGVACLLLLWPVIIIFHYSGVEPFALPNNGQVRLIAFNAMIDSTMSITNLIGVAWSSSLFMSVGSVLSLPSSVVADKLLHSYSVPGLTYFGIVLVFFGFLGMNLADYRHQRKQAGASHS